MPAMKVWNGSSWDIISGPPGQAGGGGGGGVAMQIAGNTAGATALVSSGTLTLVGGDNITLNQAGNAITIMQPEVSRSLLFDTFNQNFLSHGNATLMIQPAQIRGALTATEFNWFMSGSVSSNAGTLSAWAGLYDVVNVTSLAMLSSGSVSYTFSGASSTLYNSVRQWSMPFNVNAVRGDYALALVIRSSGNGSWSVCGASTNAFQGPAGVAVNATNKLLPFLGRYSTTTAGIPANIPSASIVGSGSGARRWDYMFRALGA